MSLFDFFKQIRLGGTPVIARSALNFSGSGVSVTDDPANGATNVNITAGSLTNWTRGSTTGGEDATDLITCAANSTTTLYTLPSPAIVLGEEVSLTAAIVADGIGGSVGGAHWERRIVVKNVKGVGIQTVDGTQLDTDVTASNTSNISSALAGCSAKIVVSGGTLAVQLTTPVGVSVNARCSVSWDRSPGNAASSTPSWSMPGALHMWRGDGFSVSGSNINSIADAVGSATQTAGATKPTTTTLGSNSRAAATFVTGSYFASSGGLAETMTSGALFFVMQFTTGTTQFAIMDAGETSAPTSFEILARYAGGGSGLPIRLDLDNGQTNPLSGGVLNTGTLYDVLITWDGTSRYIYVNGTLVNSVTGSALAPNTTVDKWVLGVLADLTTIPASVGGLVIGEARTGNQKLTGTDATNGHNYRTAYYA